MKPSKTLSGLFHFGEYSGAEEQYKISSKKDPEENPGTSSYIRVKKFFLPGERMKNSCAQLENSGYQEDSTLNSEATIAFLDKIGESYPTKKKIHVFSDNARYYKNRHVQKHLEGSKVKLHFLPTYSPNLNPIERLWKWMKERVLYNTYYQEFDDFKQAVFGFLQCVANPDPKSDFGKTFSNRVKDRFRTIGAPIPNS